MHLTNLTFLTKSNLTHMTTSELIPHIEALVFASDRPLTTLEICELVNDAFSFMDDKISLDQVESALEGIVEKYKADFYPFEITMSGGGWQFLTRKEYHKTVAQLNGDKYLKRLSQASLETLSIIAYKQPVTKGDIEAIRGVNSDYSVQKLLDKELIIISGRNENQPGQPLLYSTSGSFMDYFGINSHDDLPKISEVSGLETLEPTTMTNTLFGEKTIVEETDDSELLSVTEGGELIRKEDPEEEG